MYVKNLKLCNSLYLTVKMRIIISSQAIQQSPVVF